MFALKSAKGGGKLFLHGISRQAKQLTKAVPGFRQTAEGTKSPENEPKEEGKSIQGLHSVDLTLATTVQLAFTALKKE